MIYSSLKKITRRLLPDNLLYTLEPALRKIYSLSYIGNKVYCPVCEKAFSNFILLENGRDSICPACGALPRNRLLWLYLQKEIKIADQRIKVLHFSPSRSILRNLKKLHNLSYTTTDYESNRADKKYDITRINDKDNAYHLIICYHVLEHIIDDVKAIKELFRIMKPGGISLLQVPLKQGQTYEDESIISPQERLKHFGQEDHVRIYGQEDFQERLKAAGFNVSPIQYAKQFNEAEISKFSLWKEETIFVCRK